MHKFHILLTLQIAFTNFSQELASATTFQRCSAAVCLRPWRMWCGRLRGSEAENCTFLTLRLVRRANCCSFVKYEEVDGDGGLHSPKKRVPNPSVKSFKV